MSNYPISNANRKSTEWIVPQFVDFDHMLEHFHRKSGFPKEEVRANLKKLKRLGLIKYSTKTKNKPIIKLVFSEENKPLFDSYFTLNRR